MSQEKQFIRQNALKFRESLAPHPDWAEAAAALFFDVVGVVQARKIALYFPIGNELDTLPLVEQIWAKGGDCFLPVFDKTDRDMRFACWGRDTKLEKGDFGVPMPSSPVFAIPDIVVVPVVAFDQKGNRMGHGQGFYDATLAKLRAQQDVLVIGWAYAEQAVLMKLPTESHDQKMDLVITPQRVFDFRI